VRNGSSTSGTWQFAGTWLMEEIISHIALSTILFEIPASLTKGFTKLSVKIQFVSSHVELERIPIYNLLAYTSNPDNKKFLIFVILKR